MHELKTNKIKNLNLVVTTYCTIKAGKINLNGKIDFESEDTDFRKFIRTAYRHYKIDYPKFFKMDNLSKLGFLSAELLLKDRPLTEFYSPGDIGILIENRSSSLETDEKHQEAINDRNNYFPSPKIFVYTLPNIMAGEISIRHKIRGENSIFLFDHFDTAFIVDYIKALFDEHAIQSCIGGWVECYHEFYESLLFIVETEEVANKTNGQHECGIFAAGYIEYLFNN